MAHFVGLDVSVKETSVCVPSATCRLKLTQDTRPAVVRTVPPTTDGRPGF